MNLKRTVLSIFGHPKHNCETGTRTGPVFGPNRLCGAFVCSHPPEVGPGQESRHRVIIFHKYPQESIKSQIRLRVDKSSPLRYRFDPDKPKKSLISQMWPVQTRPLSTAPDEERRFGLGAWGSFADLEIQLQRSSGNVDVDKCAVEVIVKIGQVSLDEIKPEVKLATK